MSRYFCVITASDHVTRILKEYGDTLERAAAAAPPQATRDAGPQLRVLRCVLLAHRAYWCDALELHVILRCNWFVNEAPPACRAHTCTKYRALRLPQQAPGPLRGTTVDCD